LLPKLPALDLAFDGFNIERVVLSDRLIIQWEQVMPHG
jgi:hypothetical protein